MGEALKMYGVRERMEAQPWTPSDTSSCVTGPMQPWSWVCIAGGAPYWTHEPMAARMMADKHRIHVKRDCLYIHRYQAQAVEVIDGGAASEAKPI